MISQNVRSRQERIEELEVLKQKNIQLQNQLEKEFRLGNIIGNSSKMRDVYSLVTMVAETNSTVLIRGESGIGNELIADAIYFSSPRAKKNFIKVNCSALPDTLIESELFGHEKGAFAGTETIKIDVRIVCATNRNLEDMIQNNEFREDLYYRINVFPIFVPPLRDRRNDIPSHVDHFSRNSTNETMQNKQDYNFCLKYVDGLPRWSGNIPELENCIERACILCKDNVIHSYDLPPSLQTVDSANTKSSGGMMFTIEQVEKQLIREALVSSKGNIAKAAEELKVTERMLGIRLKKYEIDAWGFMV